MNCHLLFMLGDEFSPELQLLCVSEDVDIACGFNEGVAEVPDGGEVTRHAKAEDKNESCHETVFSGNWRRC